MLFDRSTRMLLAGAVVMALALPALAATKPTISIANIGMGQKISSGSIPVKVSTTDFTVECRDVGKPGMPDQGHIHAMLDGMSMAQLTNFYCSKSFDISGAGVGPGKHQLSVVLADDAHMMVGKPAMVSFDYEPTAAQSLPAPRDGGASSVSIVSPVNGATVGKKFELTVAVHNFTLSCDAEGKADEHGVGHLHVFVHQAGVTDMGHPMMSSATSMSGGMNEGGMSGGGMSGGGMSMVGMVGMPCTKTVPIDLSTWKSGKANILVMLANNDHNPTSGAQAASLSVNLR